MRGEGQDSKIGKIEYKKNRGIVGYDRDIERQDKIGDRVISIDIRNS